MDPLIHSLIELEKRQTDGAEKRIEMLNKLETEGYLSRDEAEHLYIFYGHMPEFRDLVAVDG